MKKASVLVAVRGSLSGYDLDEIVAFTGISAIDFAPQYKDSMGYGRNFPTDTPIFTEQDCNEEGFYLIIHPGHPGWSVPGKTSAEVFVTVAATIVKGWVRDRAIHAVDILLSCLGDHVIMSRATKVAADDYLDYMARVFGVINQHATNLPRHWKIQELKLLGKNNLILMRVGNDSE